MLRQRGWRIGRPSSRREVMCCKKHAITHARVMKKAPLGCLCHSFVTLRLLTERLSQLAQPHQGEQQKGYAPPEWRPGEPSAPFALRRETDGMDHPDTGRVEQPHAHRKRDTTHTLSEGFWRPHYLAAPAQGTGQ
nr:hypothetical protein [Salinivibrio kushneri]